MAVQFRGTQSWQVSWGTGYVVQLALYLRDALALPAAPEVPPLTPPVPITDELDRAAVAAEWPGWWADVLAFVGDSLDNRPDQHLRLPVRPDAPALVDRPAIRAALDLLGHEPITIPNRAGRPTSESATSSEPGRPRWVDRLGRFGWW
jgi:hypothetical protein